LRKSTYDRIYAAISDFEIIDSHEHIPPEQERLEWKLDFFTLFSGYTRVDLLSAGLPQKDFDRLQDAELPLEYRWRIFAPYFEHIRYGSYARPAFIAAKEFYGFDKIDETTYVPLSEAMQAANKPGIYQRILRDKCKIRVSLTQVEKTKFDVDFLLPVLWIDRFCRVTTWEHVAKQAAELNEPLNSIDDYLRIMDKGVARWKSEGVVGLKMWSRTFQEPNRAEATAIFENLRTGVVKEVPVESPLRDFLTDHILKLCAREALPVAVHSGMWDDFRRSEPTQMIPTFQRHPETNFDLYHGGMPWMRQTGIIGKNFPNVWLDLCWSHVISPKMTRSALNEWVDLVPMNKIIGFGGDYGVQVEKVYGALTMARENISAVLSSRVEEGLMSEEEAVGVAHKWLYDNPKAVYGLK